MTVQATAAAQIALLRWIDRGFRFEPPARNWRFETRVLMNVVAQLWSCPDTLADADCDSMRVPRGSTYGEAVQKIWREYFGEEEEPPDIADKRISPSVGTT
jgi:hypothetical protein